MSRMQVEQWLEQFISQHALIFSVTAIIFIIAYLLLIESLMNRTKSNNFVLQIIQHMKRNSLPKTENELKTDTSKDCWQKKFLFLIKLCTTLSIGFYFFFSFYLKKNFIFLNLLTGILMIVYGILLFWMPHTLPKETASEAFLLKSSSVTKWLFVCFGLVVLLLSLPV